MSKHPVTLLLDHVRPTLGLETCAINLLDQLGSMVDVVCIGEAERGLPEILPSATSLGGPLRGWRRVASLPRLRRWLRSAPVEGTVVVAGAWAALPLLAVAPRRRPRVIVWEHSLSSEKTGSAKGLRILSRAARLLYRRASLVVCVSQDLRDQVAAWLPSVPVIVIPNYLPALRAADTLPGVRQPETGAGGVRLLTVGSLSATKNHRLLLEAMRLLPPTFTLAVAGDGELVGELEDLAHEWGIQDRVTFLGHVEDVASWYAWADIVVQPAWGETFGLAMFEAAAAHRPVVSLEYGLSRALFDGAIPGRLVAPTPEAMAEAIEGLATAPPTEADYVDADRVRAEAFDAESITRAWREVLERQPSAPAVAP